MSKEHMRLKCLYNIGALRNLHVMSHEHPQPSPLLAPAF
jgi:hypothetical protein